MSEYFKKYPVLADAENGSKLIDIDFDELFDSDAAQLFVKWDSFFEKLIAISKTTKVKGTLEQLLKLLADKEINQRKLTTSITSMTSITTFIYSCIYANIRLLLSISQF